MIERIVNKLVRLAREPIRRMQAKSALTQLSSHSAVKVQAVGEAVREALAGQVSPEEQVLIGAIEQRRGELLRSKREVPKLDFGAGGPSSSRSKEEMQHGVSSTSRVCDIARASKPKNWALILFKLAQKLRPISCVELGSCVGISAAYQAGAQSLDEKGGNFVTLEGSPDTAKIAQETLDILGLKNASVVVGPFHETLKGVLEKASPIDYFFNDGHHDHDAVLQYFDESIPFLADDAIIIFDDISWSDDMRAAWEKIERDDRVAASIDLDEVGIALLGKGTKTKFRIPL